MTDRTYRIILGVAILLALYFELAVLVYILITMLFIESLTRYSVPRLVGVIGSAAGTQALTYRAEPCNSDFRFNFDVELVWRFLMAVMLLLSYSFYEYLWFFPWFMGFAVMGAGVSGICPMLFALRWIGFK